MIIPRVRRPGEVTAILLSTVEADRLVEWWRRHPPAKDRPHAATLHTHAALVSGRRCVAPDLLPEGTLGSVCGKGVERDAPHGWLCWRHYATAHGIKVPPPVEVPRVKDEVPRVKDDEV